MKKILSILAIAAAVMFAACEKVDLSDIESRLDKLEAAVKTIQEARDGGDYITDVTPIMEGNEIVGYEITFKEHGKVTVRNGKNGTDGDSMFSSVTVTDENVTFVTSDGKTFVIPRDGASVFGIVIETRAYTVTAPGQEINVPYTLKGADNATTVSAIAGDGYKAVITDKAIVITAPALPTDTQVLAVAENGAGKSSVVVIKISIADELKPDNLAKNKWTSEAAAIIDGKTDTYAEGTSFVIKLGVQKNFSSIILAQAADIKNATLASKFTLETSTDGSTWTVALADATLAGRTGSQIFNLGTVVSASSIRITLSAPFEESLPVRLAEVDLGIGESATCTPTELTAVPALKNAKKPFQTDGSDLAPNVGAGRFQRVLDWKTSDNVYISFDNHPSVMAMACWGAAVWGISMPTNAKVWQTLAFTPGYYAVNVQIGHTGNPYGVDIDFAAATGDALPDFSDVSTAANTLAYVAGKEHQNETYPLAFKIEEAGNVSIGMVYNLYNTWSLNGSAYSDFYIHGFEVVGR